MADNYLERKMEEYRSGKLSARVKSGVSRSLPKGKIAVDFPPRTVILAAAAIGPVCRAVVKSFIDAGCRVALVSACHKEATELARSFGARFYPVAGFSPASIDSVLDSVVEDVTSHWNIPDTFIFVSDVEGADVNNAFLTMDYSRFEQTPGTLRIINIMAGEGGDALGMSLNGVPGCSYALLVPDAGDGHASETAALCLYLCQPCGRFFSGLTVSV